MTNTSSPVTSEALANKLAATPLDQSHDEWPTIVPIRLSETERELAVNVLRRAARSSAGTDSARKALADCLGCVEAAEAEGLHELIVELRGSNDTVDRLIDLIDRRLLWVREYAAPVLSQTDAPAQPSGGVAAIAAERERQISKEGWTPEHDDQHRHGEMADAAALYASLQVRNLSGFATWPWDASWWKPTSRRRDLVKAGALIAAEIDRLDRASAISSTDRSCTCHPSEAPVPCQRKYAFSECQAAALSSSDRATSTEQVPSEPAASRASHYS